MKNVWKLLPAIASSVYSLIFWGNVFVCAMELMGLVTKSPQYSLFVVLYLGWALTLTAIHCLKTGAEDLRTYYPGKNWLERKARLAS